MRQDHFKRDKIRNGKKRPDYFKRDEKDEKRRPDNCKRDEKI